jgi:hypothetical protein
MPPVNEDGSGNLFDLDMRYKYLLSLVTNESLTFQLTERGLNSKEAAGGFET